MYGGGGGFGGSGGGWTPWAAGGAGGGMNPQLMQQQQQQQHGFRQGMMNQQGGYVGNAAGVNANMMPLGGGMNYGGAGANVLTGMGLNSGVGGMVGMYGVNAAVSNPSLLMGTNSMGVSGNMYGMSGNAFGQQQQTNQYLQHQQMQNLQQQQQQQQSQSVFQTQTGYPRPQQPPLPPGPPPSKPVSNSRPPPPLPPPNNSYGSNSSGAKPPPPPLPKTSPSEYTKSPGTGGGNYNTQRRFEPPASSPNLDSSRRKQQTGEPVIPDQILKLLQNAESARQIQQAAEALSSVNPMTSLNVSQELFGVKTDTQKEKIPGLDFDDVQRDLMENRSSFLPGGSKNNSNNSNKSDSSNADRVKRVDVDKIQDPSTDKAAQKSRWSNENAETESKKESGANSLAPQHNQSDRKESNKSPEIIWELRPEVQSEISLSGSKEAQDRLNQEKQQSITGGLSNSASIMPSAASPAMSSNADNLRNKMESSSEQRSLSGNNPEDTVEAAPAKIPLESNDGKPIEYDKKTLRAFDKKFREWEQQFENWKASNQNHPDRNAYNKYMEQWDRWRQQLIEQRRFIIDSMNQAKLEGAELAMQKLERDIREGRYEQTVSDTTSKGPNEAAVADSRFGKQPSAVGSQNQKFPDKPGFKTPEWDQKEDDSEWNRGNRTPPWYRNEDFTSEPEIETPFVKNPHYRGSAENSLPKESGPKPLMAISVEPPLQSKDSYAPNPFQVGGPSGMSESPNPFARDGFQPNKIQSENQSERDNERLVERIPRDKDRPLPILGNRPTPMDGRNKNSPSTPSSDRVARDPEGGRQGLGLRNRVNQDLLDPDPWAAMNRPDVNPFNEALTKNQSMAAPFGGWGRTSEDNLPKLSDFLQQDAVSHTELVGGRGAMANRPGLLNNPDIPYTNRFSEELPGVRRDRQIHPAQETQFNRRPIQTSGDMPYGSSYKGLSHAQASGSRPFHTLLAQDNVADEYEEEEDPASSAACQWFTRDRSRAFEEEEEASFQEEPQEHASNNDYEWEPDTPAVIDYGHGSKETDDGDEFDLPKGERNEDDDETDDERDRDVVTIDYGHGSGGRDLPTNEDFTRERFRIERRLPANDEYYEQEEAFNDAYAEEPYRDYSDYSRIPGASHMRGRGVEMSRGRGSITRGRGRGITVGTPLPPSQTRRPPDLGYGRELQQLPSLPRNEGRGIVSHSDLAPLEMGRPVPNRGSGRGVPIMPPIYSAEPESVSVGRGRGAFGSRPTGRQFEESRPYEDDLETERVDSPEIMIVSSARREQGVRRAPREFSKDDRTDRSRDRIPRERDSGRSSRRDADLDFRKPGRSNEDFMPSAFLEESWEPEDQVQNKSVERIAPKRDEDNRRVRRDSSPPVRRDRERDRERDRDRDKDSSRDRHSSRFRKRSRSRSPFSRGGGDFKNPSSSGSTVHGSSSMEMMGGVNPPPPRYQTVMVEDILNKPGRFKRPSQIVVILRGLPGSGKTHVAKLMKDREMEMGGSAPRILSLDDYFMTETETTVKDPVTGAESKETLMQFEFEEDMEPKYRNDLIKTFKKTLENGYFPFIIVDCVNAVVKHFEEMVSYATQKRFQVYVAEVDESVETCVKRNIHNRTKDQIQKLHKMWERTPPQFIKLDIRPLLQDEAVQDVEMEDVSDTEIVDKVQVSKVPISTPATASWEEDEQEKFPTTSKWETIDHSEEKLNRLDGLNVRRKQSEDDKVDSLNSSIDSWLHSHLPEDYASRQQTFPGRKRVRWADIEEKQAQERMRDVGFVVGHTDWNRMTDPTFGSSALTRTKYI